MGKYNKRPQLRSVKRAWSRKRTPRGMNLGADYSDVITPSGMDASDIHETKWGGV